MYYGYYGGNFNGNSSAAQHSYYSRPHAVIEAVGEGSVSVAPDQAVIVLGVETEGKELSAAQEENDAAIVSIIDALIEEGVPRDQIQTSDYRIEMQYDYPDGQQVFRGFKVVHLLRITTDKVDQAGAIVDTAILHGANTIVSIRFGLQSGAVPTNEALSRAVKDAQVKAATIAGTLGVAIASVPTYVRELQASSEPVPFKAAVALASEVTPIEPGQLTVRSSVRAWFSVV
ncbi:SIMPL domain-containing protein [Paenibacillus sp. NEAU-GSW1]|uniref:SIMPL domain-containing protein n=1 Tax=Paenibacillus sp. NEAU-GSW1 TaxID=2682486 RepID=UPI001C1298F1|nr:SIMPL domain-containing protein [Paenibacillus sp. NEAU-GSW1]